MLKKVLSLVLVVSLLAVSTLISVPAFAEEEPAAYGTSFYASFENNDASATSLPLKENTPFEINGVVQAQNMGEWVAEAAGMDVVGNFTANVTGVTGTAAYSTSYALTKLLDGSTSTYYQTRQSGQVDIIYTLSEASALGVYGVGVNNANYGPTAWTVYGSNDGETWTALNAVSGVSLAAGAYYYTVENKTAYTQYKLSVTGRRSSSRFYLSDWILGTNIAPPVEDDDDIVYSLNAYKSGNPSTNFISPQTGGWNGSGTLKVEGVQTAANAFAKNVLYENVNVLVEPDTMLEYAVLPDYANANNYSGFDFEYTSQHIAIDLQFTDGTFLSQLGAVDQYENSIAAAAQGEGKYLYSRQWNIVRSRVGKVANGKVIDKVLVVFDKATKGSDDDVKVQAYFDDIKIRPVAEKKVSSVVEYADIRVGSNDKALYSRGLQWPAVMTPNGFNYWVPCTTASGNKLYEYYPGNKGITHFTVSHEASYWIGDYGTFQFMANSSINPASATSSNIAASYRQSKFDRDNEIANPNYYSVKFNEGTPASGVKVEITPTEHAAMVRMTYPADSSFVNVIFDSVNASSNGYLNFYEDGSFGARTAHVGSEGGQRRMYIYGKFNTVPQSTSVLASARPRAIATFANGTTEVTFKLATSFISEEQAKKNLELEIAADATFDDVKATATAAWENILGRVEVEGASEEQLIELYTYLYHAYFSPNLLSENTGTAEEPVWSYSSPYKGSATAPEIVSGYRFYYNNGFWDTFRGSWSTYALLTPTYDTQLLNGLVQHYVDNNWIPRWVAPGGRNSMVGTSSDIIFGDSIAKGIQFDWQTAYTASKKNATVYSSNAINGGRTGMDNSVFLGYTNATVDSNKGLSWSIDNYLNDYGISVMAEKLGYDADAEYFKNRAQNYVNLFTPINGGWFAGKLATGAWRTDINTLNPIDPDVADYEETNAWTMAFTVTQDYKGLANLYGGYDMLGNKLDTFFTTNALKDARNYVLDFVDTKMGLYGQANQPGHHIPFVYDYIGQPYKTQALTREILDRVYVGTSNGQGFPGDADNGEQGGWYTMTALGLCPISTGTDTYAITSPLHDKTTLHLESGDLTIIAKDNSKENVYIQSMTIDGVPYDKCFIKYSDFINAKEIVYQMGPNPSDWATGADAVPPSITAADDDEIANPYSDFTKSGIAVANAIPAASATDAAVFSPDASAIANLFDNNSGNQVTFSGDNASVYFYFPTAKEVKMFTLTSYTLNQAPAAVALYASNDGENWTEIANEEDISFTWTRETLPFAADAAAGYKYYRLDVAGNGGISLAEVELLGTRTAILDYDAIVKKTENEDSYATEITVDYDITGLVFRLADGTEVTPAVADPIVNADGSKTYAVEFDADSEKVFVYAKNENGYEITQSRKTLAFATIEDVVSVATDADEYKVNDDVTFTIVTDDSIGRIGIANESGKFIGLSSLSYVDNGDGTLTWTAKASFGTKGEREMSIFASKYENILADSGKKVSFTVGIAVSEGEDGVAVISVNAPTGAAVNDAFVLTVKTTTSATKVGIFDANTGKALGKLSQSYVDKNGEREWTISMKVGTKGNRTFDVKATDKTGEWSEAKSFDIIVYTLD